jgi:hypothetical protein
MLKTLFHWICAVFLMLATTSIAKAQSLGGASVEYEGWIYLPVFEPTNPLSPPGAGPELDAIVALRDDGTTAVVTGLWCEPDGSGNWTAMAWETSVPEEIASYVFDYVGGDPSDGSLEDLVLTWPVDLDPTLQLSFHGSPVVPVAFGDGVKIGDPYEPLVASNPGVLAPLESSGYAAVSTLSGSTITAGTFTNAGPPTPHDDDCIAVYQLLNALQEAFESSKKDVTIISNTFVDAVDAAAIENNQACGCTVVTVNVSDTGWVDTCGPWTQVAGPTAVGTDCRYKWQRDVTGTRTRVRRHRYSNCTWVTCTQTKVRTGVQSANTIAVRAPGTPCNPVGPAPAGVPCRCSGFFSCQSGPWVPAGCPW